MSKSSKPRSGQVKTAARREELRRNLPKPTFDPKVLLEKPEFVNAMLISLALLLVAGALVIWGREQVLVRDGQIMTSTRLKRLDYLVADEEATEAKREEVRRSSPRIYRLNDAYISRLEAALLGLPKVVAGKSSVDEEISAELRESFDLTDAGLAALQAMSADGEAIPEWSEYVEQLIDGQLRLNPLIDSQEYQVFSTTSEMNRALLGPTGLLERPLLVDAIELNPDVTGMEQRLSELVAYAGFPPEVAPFVLARLTWQPQPTLQFDQVETQNQEDGRAAAVDPVMIEHKADEPLYQRGDKLTIAQYNDVLKETDFFTAYAPAHVLWLPRLGILGLVGILLAFLSVHVFMAYPRIVRNALRMTGLALLMGGMLAVTVLVSAKTPSFMFPAAIAPTLFVAVVTLLAYDQRLALFVSGAQCVLVTLSLGHGIGWFILLIAGCGTMIAQLRDVRHRSSLIRAATVAAAVLGLGALMLGILVTPLVDGAWNQILWRAAAAVLSSFAVGFFVLGILPSIERLFDITTGMTLAELRDPKQPLLRQLQQKAPGTYNHSLQVANIAEAATDAIGADSLLVYVGALYHDIGKMNKPEYFVENQASGYNKHSKLRPTMSQLVIVGHVKDGIELAREYGLPRSVQHFIESHQGTTLVEYFYHAAKTQAEADEKASVDEVEFRYSGPKPRTKEAAVLMLADAVESATRAMTEPNPSRIETLVREMSRKRLIDGQFDQSDLTFRELGLIEDAMINRLCAIHHGRISYPTAKTEEAADREAEDTKPATA
ncbi:MAG: HDIG domain-containing protein [Phycisphaerales bacterium]|nr:MAG: HDIG domain-containing protein [Phycisphaerales bacterium]